MKVIFALAVLVALSAAAWSLLPKTTSDTAVAVDDASERTLLQTIKRAGYPCAGIISWSGAPRQPATVVCRIDGRNGATPYLVSPDTGRVTPG